MQSLVECTPQTEAAALPLTMHLCIIEGMGVGGGGECDWLSREPDWVVALGRSFRFHLVSEPLLKQLEKNYVKVQIEKGFGETFNIYEESGPFALLQTRPS